MNRIFALALGLALASAARAQAPAASDVGSTPALPRSAEPITSVTHPAAPERGAPPVFPPARERERDSWYIGFGLGAGGGSLDIGGDRSSFRDLIGRDATGLGLNFRAGFTVSPRLLVGFDGSAVGAQALEPEERFQLNAYDLGAMYFPWERGLYVRAAIGRSVLVVATDGPVLQGSGSYGGWNVLGGAGYAFWLGQAFNLSVNLDYQAHTFRSSGPIDVDGARGWSAWLGFDWY